MNKVEKKTYIKTVLLLSTVFVLLYVSYFYFPPKIADFSAEIIDKEKKIEQLNIQNNQIENVRIKHKELQENIDNVSESVIDYSNIFNFVTETKNIAEKNNINLNLSVSKEEKKQITEFLSYINYNIKADGKFSDMMNFLSYLENLKYYVDVEEIKISNENKEAIDDANVVLDSKLKVYTRDNK